MEIYGLNDNGIRLAKTQRDLTPMQRFAYALARQEHGPDDAEVPQSYERAQRATRGI